MKAFITGSRAYGTPTAISDIDLVVFLDKEEKELLEALCFSGTKAVRFGKLNLIIVTNKGQYWAWRKMTEEMAEEAAMGFPVGKEEAKRRIEAALAKAGEKQDGVSE
jgi:hypothetical protein